MNSSKFQRKRLCAAVVAALATTASPALAEIEEIVVTATKREASAQDIPIAVTALGEKALEELNITDFADYLVQLPSVTAGGSGPGINTIYIRGLASTTPNLATAGVAGLTPNVALYLDEQPLTMPGRNLDVYAVDLNRVEVLKGPQGTLFGASSQAGNVRLITNKPDQSGTYGKVKVGASFTPEGDEGYKVEAVFNLPVTDEFALRGVAYTDQQGGYIDNVQGTRSVRESHRFTPEGTQAIPVLTGVTFNDADNSNLVEKDFNEASWTGFRLSGLWNINDDWDLLLGYSQQTIDSDGVFFVDPELADLEISRFSRDVFEDKYKSYNWTLEGRLGELDVIYTGAYTDWEVDGIIDYTDYLFTAEYLPYYICDYSVTHEKYTTDDNNTPSDPSDDVLGNRNLSHVDAVNAPSGVCHSPATLVTSSLKTDFQTHEFRVATDQTRRVRGVAGVFFSKMELKELNDFTFPSGEMTLAANNTDRGWGPNFSATPASTQLQTQWPEGVIWRNDVLRKDDQLGVFGEVSIDLSDEYILAIGTRWYDIEVDLLGSAAGSWGNRGETRDMNDGNNLDRLFSAATENSSDKAETDGVIGRVSLSWIPDANQLYYLTLAEGFRSGILNRPGGSGPCRDRNKMPLPNCNNPYTVPYPVDTDDVISFEIGWKLDFLDNTLRFNGDLFYIDISDLQINIFDPAISNLFFSDNAADARVIGLEGDFIWAATPNLTVGGGFAFLDSKITDSHVTRFVREDDDLAFAPNIQLNLNARYEWPVGKGLTMHVTPSLSYAGEASTDIVHPRVMTLDSWALFNLSMGVSADEWNAELYIENLFDERAEVSGSHQFNRPRVTVARPLTVGFRYTYQF